MVELTEAKNISGNTVKVVDKYTDVSRFIQVSQ